MTQSNPLPLQGVEAALHRAAERARLVAQQTHTPLVILKDGRIERQIPVTEPDKSAERKAG